MRRRAGELRQVVHRLRAKRLVKLLRGYRPVLPRPDPRVDDVAMSALLKPLHEVAETSEKPALWLTRGLRRLGLAGCRWRGLRRRSAASEKAPEPAAAGCTRAEQRGQRNQQRFRHTAAGNSGAQHVVQKPHCRLL